MTEKEPREHGIIFGRGDELGDDVEEPPMAYTPGAIRIPGYAPRRSHLARRPRKTSS